MHNCVRCGRAAASLEEINNGCPCGSKVFVFNREAVEGERKQDEAPSGPASPQQQAAVQPSAPAQQAAPAGEGEAVSSLQKPAASEKDSLLFSVKKAAPSSQGEKDDADGKAPESYFARATFTSEDVENIKIVREGVFLVDLKALYSNPVVLKDEEGVYYVKLPFEGSGKTGGKPLGGEGKNGF
ncbi:Zn-ribbon containing protein [uncultured archaeon]|nr:Zn-ribbon containing protein [uncultured archaeon]